MVFLLSDLIIKNAKNKAKMNTKADNNDLFVILIVDFYDISSKISHVNVRNQTCECDS